MNVFEKHVITVAQSFDHLEKKMDNGFAMMMREFSINREEHREFRNSITTLNTIVMKHERSIDDLQDSVTLLEESN